MDVIEKHNLIIGGIIAAFTYVFGEHWGLFAIFLMFNIADYITGIMKSKLAHKENSVKGLQGIMKKLGYWLMVFIAFAAGYWFISMGELLGIDLQITKLIGWFVLASLTVNELRSILENFVEAGFDVPKILVEGLEVADKAFNKGKEDESDG
jgi:toxin secretion/phage lysis holin